MVGGKIGRRLLRPAGNDWELWEGEPWELRGQGALEELSPGSEASLALPARMVIAAPLWLEGIDVSLVREMAAVELDVRGLLPNAGADALDVRVVTVLSERTLVCAHVYPTGLPERFSHRVFARFNASPAFAALQPDCLHLWREEGDLIAVFTRGEEAVYWEPIRNPTPDLERIGLMLIAEAVLVAPLNFQNYSLEQLPAPSYCHSSLSVEAALPSLRDRPPVCEWKSPTRRAWEDRIRKRTSAIRLGVVAAAVYLAVAVCLGAWLGWQHWEVARLEHQIAEREPEIRRLQQAGREWNAVVTTIEAPRFPVEVLLQLVQQMPPEGIRLTQFEFDDPKVALLGEAQSVSIASHFLSQINGARELAHIRWEMPPPTLLPNNTARFVIAGAMTHEEN